MCRSGLNSSILVFVGTQGRWCGQTQEESGKDKRWVPHVRTKRSCTHFFLTLRMASLMKTRGCITGQKWSQAEAMPDDWHLGSLLWRKRLVGAHHYLIIIHAWKLEIIPWASSLSPTSNPSSGLLILLLNISQYCCFSPRYFFCLGYSSSLLSLCLIFQHQLKGYPSEKSSLNLLV